MNRDKLIQQVKSEYQRLADLQSQEHITDQSFRSMTPEAYYEQALEKAIQDISAGEYDDCVSGLQVVERIANQKNEDQ